MSNIEMSRDSKTHHKGPVIILFTSPIALHPAWYFGTLTSDNTALSNWLGIFQTSVKDVSISGEMWYTAPAS